MKILTVPGHKDAQHHGGQSEGVLQLNVDQDQNHHVLYVVDSVVSVCVKIEVAMLLPLR